MAVVKKGADYHCERQESAGSGKERCGLPLGAAGKQWQW